jgi:hypothetical protein
LSQRELEFTLNSKRFISIVENAVKGKDQFSNTLMKILISVLALGAIQEDLLILTRMTLNIEIIKSLQFKKPLEVCLLEEFQGKKKSFY